MELGSRTSKRVRLMLLAVAPVSLLFATGIFASPAAAATGSPALAVSPNAGIVGSTMTVTGSGFGPNEALSLQWASLTSNWLVEAIPTPQVTGITKTPIQITLGSVETDSSGAFSAKVAVPTDYGGTHYLQAFLANGTALPPQASFIVEPSFHISPTSGPAGTPIQVTASGLSNHLYSTSYHLSWDNKYVGYMTALGSQGATNFTFYASGVPGTHFIDIYQGYPGPGYLNPQQGPPSSETQSIFGSYIPFYANFTVTSENVVPSSSQTGAAGLITGVSVQLGAFAFLAAVMVGGGFYLSRKDPEERAAISRMFVALAIIVIVAVAGLGAYAASAGSTSSTNSSSTTSSNSQGSTLPQVVFTPVATSYRPPITVPTNNATTGPRISVSPDIANVGDTVNVTGLGFSPNTQLPITWSTTHGSNLLGYKQVNNQLREVTTSGAGSFSFTMKVPSDLGGVHYIAAANLTQRSNGTLFIQRSASISTTQGPQGTLIQVIMQGVGWDFNTNIVAVDYDNSYIGYGCGFNSGGNVTISIVASGSPGIHTVDVYPSIWWGPSTFTSQQVVEYRYPVLTPQDHPEHMPSFHFTFLMTP